MRIALVHDYIKEYGGAERVLETLHEIYPDAPIYTSLYYPQFLGPHRERFEKMKIKTSFLQYIPFGYKLISPLRLLSPIAFKSFNFSDVDVIVVSQTGAYFPNALNKKNAKLYTYTHTPPRYLYGYKTAREWKNNKIMAIVGEIANHFLRMIDYYASRNVDQFIANSEEVKRRIQKFYRKDAIVVYPPVEINSKHEIRNSNLNKDYYLAGGRLARAKGMDIIIDAFNTNGKKLIVFGKGFAGYGEQLVQKAQVNISFVGEVTDQEKLDLMHGAKAYVFASYNEDFGITPVEAQSQGTPVIAYKSGGVQETVIDPSAHKLCSAQASSGQVGATGVFYDENTPEKLNGAIKKFEQIKIKAEDCKKQAEKFSKEVFCKKIKVLIK